MTEPLGLTRGSVILAGYDSRWPDLYAAESKRIRTAGSPLEKLVVEHMGSTAVPGLCAKPIVDILAGYPSGAEPYDFIVELVRAGYVHRGEQGIPGREFLRRGDPRMYHVHLTAFESPFWNDQIAFRDALRRDDALRDRYAALKTALAAKFPKDRESYIEGKGPFVTATVATIRRASDTRNS